MAALMAYSTREDIPLYVKDVKDYGIELLGPDVNKSVVLTSPTRQGRSIRFGLDGLKDMGAAAAKIVADRKMRGVFTDMRNFIIRCTIAGIDKAAIVSLINSGAMSDLVSNRQESVTNVPIYLSACRDAIKQFLQKNEDVAALMETDKGAAEEKIFQYLSDESNFVLPEGVSSPEYDEDEMLRIEKEYTGFYVSGNPLDKHEALMRKFTRTEIATLQASSKDVTLAGLVSGFKQIKRKKDDALMGKFELEDLTGVLSAVCFPYAYEKYSEQITDGSVVVIKGNVEVETDADGNVMSRQFIVTSVRKIA